MKDFARTYFKVSQIVDLIFAILFAITIAGIIFAIPFYFASKKFKAAYNATNEELIEKRGNLLGWGIFNAIVLAPSGVGLVAILICAVTVNDYIKKLEDGDLEKANRDFGKVVEDTVSSAGTVIKDTAKSAVEGTKEVFGVKSKLDKEKEQLVKLKELKDEGLLNDEEYEAKRKQILKID